jgi:hypothetical protein
MTYEVPIRCREGIGKQKLSTWRDGLSITSSIFRLARDYNLAFLLSFIAGLLAIPGIGILGWVLTERYAMGVMHIGWAIVLRNSFANFRDSNYLGNDFSSDETNVDKTLEENL